MKGSRSRSLSQFDKNPFDVMPDEFVDQRGIDGTSSTASFDHFCADVLSEGPIMDGPLDPFWDDDSSTSASVDSSPMGWPYNAREKSRLAKLHSLPRMVNSRQTVEWDEPKEKKVEVIADDASEIEMMKERFAKLLLGEDLSGSGKGVSSALAISNAITNLSASVFGELYRVEPLSKERKARWKREMGWLLSVCDHIVEFVPSSQSLADGSVMEVMVTKQRSDLHMNLPALRKLDAMLMDSLDTFTKPEFWYDRARDASDKDGELKRQEEKWWLPTPRVPPEGLSQEARKILQQQRESINQILKAALAINAQILAEMEVPSIYWDALPKNGRSSLGEGLYRTITSENFSPDALISTIDSTSEHNVLELVNCVEAAIHIWRRKLQTKQIQSGKDGKNGSKSAWGLSSKEGAIDLEKREMLAEKVEGLLLLLRHKFPGLPQTILDINKIQYNKDVGQSILESYSRVLESLAFNILSRIDDVLHVDDAAARTKQHLSLSRNSSVHKSKETNFFGLSKSASTHVIGSMSPTRVSQNKSMSDFGHWGAKAAPGELKEGVETCGQKWLYSGNMNAMQSPLSRD